MRRIWHKTIKVEKNYIIQDKNEYVIAKLEDRHGEQWETLFVFRNLKDNFTWGCNGLQFIDGHLRIYQDTICNRISSGLNLLTFDKQKYEKDKNLSKDK